MIKMSKLLVRSTPKLTNDIPPASLAGKKIMILLSDPSRKRHIRKAWRLTEYDIEAANRLKEALGELPEMEFSLLEDHTQLLKTLMETPPDFVFNLCDDGYRNNPFLELHIPALLELLGIPYTGGDPTCLALCFDKSAVRAIAKEKGIPVPTEIFVTEKDRFVTAPSDLPLLLKPNLADGSVGITVKSVVTEPSHLNSRIREIRKLTGWKTPILVQEFLTGAEYSIGIIGNPGKSLRILKPLEVDYSGLDHEDLPKICGFEAKWEEDSIFYKTVKYVKADLSDSEKEAMVNDSVYLFSRLGCRDYARFDWRADAHGKVKLLEVNPNPGWTWDGKLSLMCSFENTSYPEMLHMILSSALERILKRRVPRNNLIAS